MVWWSVMVFIVVVSYGVYRGGQLWCLSYLSAMVFIVVVSYGVYGGGQLWYLSWRSVLLVEKMYMDVIIK